MSIPCSEPGCEEAATCDAYDVHWTFLASYCLDHGREAFAREGERVRALGLGDAFVPEIRNATPPGAGGAHFLRPHDPGPCPHGRERRSCPDPECERRRAWEDDLTLEGEWAEEYRRQGGRLVRLR